MQNLSSRKFTPAEDLRLLFIRCENPQATWTQIAAIFHAKFKVKMSPPLLKNRFEHYLNIPNLKQQQLQLINYPFLSGPKTPQDYMSLYRQILQYHGKAAASKRQAGFQKESIKKTLYPNFEENLVKFQKEAMEVLGLSNLEEQYGLLQNRPTQQLTEEQVTKLEKIQKIYFRSKQLKLENHKKITKIHRVMRTIIEAQMKGFCDDVTINQINVDKYLLKVIKNIYHNTSKLAKKIIEKQKQNQQQMYIQSNRGGYNGSYSQRALMNSQRTQKMGSRNLKKEQIFPSEPIIASNYFLQDLGAVQAHYRESKDPLYRKDIIKLYYFPQQKIQGAGQKQWETDDGESLTMKRLVTILKMFKKIEMTQLRARQKQENELRQQIQSLQKTNAPFLCDISSIGIKEDAKPSKASKASFMHMFQPQTAGRKLTIKREEKPQNYSKNSIFMISQQKKQVYKPHKPQKIQKNPSQRPFDYYHNQTKLGDLTEDLMIIDQNEYRNQTQVSRDSHRGISPQPSGQDTFIQYDYKSNYIPNNNLKSKSGNSSHKPNNQKQIRYNYHLQSLEQEPRPFRGLTSSSEVSPFQIEKSPTVRVQPQKTQQTSIQDWMNPGPTKQKKQSNYKSKTPKKKQQKTTQIIKGVQKTKNNESPIDTLTNFFDEQSLKKTAQQISQPVKETGQDYRSYLETVINSQMEDKPKRGRPPKNPKKGTFS